MKTFTDNAGRTWTVAINIDAVKRVRSLLNVDLLDITDGKLVKRLISDPVLLCDVIYVVCRPEAETKNVSDEDFGRAMAGDAIEHATTALLDELVNFSPNQRDRKSAQRVLQKTWQVMDRARDLVERKIDSELDQVAERALANAGLSPGDSQESSESTPAH
ncbi:MAG TPA: hypothetical protein PK098_06690 [Phycisphaerales bacterium]|nr:hypothetical protein [Phycisphaerales bacterium]